MWVLVGDAARGENQLLEKEYHLDRRLPKESVWISPLEQIDCDYLGS